MARARSRRGGSNNLTVFEFANEIRKKNEDAVPMLPSGATAEEAKPFVGSWCLLEHDTPEKGQFGKRFVVIVFATTCIATKRFVALYIFVVLPCLHAGHITSPRLPNFVKKTGFLSSPSMVAATRTGPHMRKIRQTYSCCLPPGLKMSWKCRKKAAASCNRT